MSTTLSPLKNIMRSEIKRKNERSKPVYLVEEQGFYGLGGNTIPQEFHVLKHICQTEATARKWLAKWIEVNHPLTEDIDPNGQGATCYYDEVPWKLPDNKSMELHQTTEKDYVAGGSYGSIESCLYYEMEMEE